MIPVKLTKRNGFDNKVQLTFQKVPKNLQVQNLAIDKGKDEALLRVFVPTTVAEGTYTLFLQATGQVSYQKNLKRLERATAGQKAAVDGLKTATDAAAAAKKAADAGTKASASATAAQKAAVPKAAAAMKALVAAQTVEKTTVAAQAAADKAATGAQVKLDLASKAAEAAKVASEKDTRKCGTNKAACGGSEDAIGRSGGIGRCSEKQQRQLLRKLRARTESHRDCYCCIDGRRQSIGRRSGCIGGCHRS